MPARNPERETAVKESIATFVNDPRVKRYARVPKGGEPTVDNYAGFISAREEFMKVVYRLLTPRRREDA